MNAGGVLNTCKLCGFLFEVFGRIAEDSSGRVSNAQGLVLKRGTTVGNHS